MGIFADMLLAAGLRRHDQHVNHISNSLFGSLPEKGRCILCGGVDSGEFSNAKQIKLHAFSSRLQRAARKSLPTLCLYSGTLPSEGPDAAVRQLREQYPDKVVRLGQDISYLPFDRNVDVEDAMRILSGSVHIYVQKAQASPGEILSFLRTMLQLLHEHWPPEMFTFSNLDIMMQSFGKNAAEFLSTLPPDAVQQAEHSLNLSWSTGVDGFWKAFRSQCAVLGPPGVRRRSLYSCLADGKLCVLCSPPAGQEMLAAALLGEMEVFQKCRRDFCLIDYDVSCKTLESSSLLQTAPGQMLFIGSTFQGLGLANCIILHPTLCCLGVSALDANDIFKMFITNGIVHHVTVGLGHHAAFTFAGVQEPPIPPDRLLTANIHDGSALILSEKGSKFISLLFFEA